MDFDRHGGQREDSWDAKFERFREWFSGEEERVLQLRMRNANVRLWLSGRLQQGKRGSGSGDSAQCHLVARGSEDFKDSVGRRGDELHSRVNEFRRDESES